MLDNINTYWARNVKIKTLRGNKFEFVLNIKNADGSDYVFEEGHVAFFGAFRRASLNALGIPIWSTADSDTIIFDTTVEDGKITINTFGEDEGFGRHLELINTFYLLITQMKQA